MAWWPCMDASTSLTEPNIGDDVIGGAAASRAAARRAVAAASQLGGWRHFLEEAAVQQSDVPSLDAKGFAGSIACWA
jgi:hypothetical protein